MLRQIRNRLFSLLIILFGLSLLTFGLTFLLPSGPVEQVVAKMGITPDPELIAQLKHEYGFDLPFPVQYANWLKGIFRGDFGYSVINNDSVNAVLARRLPNTFRLAVTSFVLMILISFPLGILSALYKNRTADYIIRYLSFIGVSIPNFWFGMMLIWVFAVRLQLLPVSGSIGWKSLIMPSLTLGVTNSAYYIRRIRSVMVEQLSEDYISGLRSRGVSDRRIVVRHVLPNSLLAVVTMLGMSFGGMLGGTMIVETVFSWNGIGKAAMEAVTGRDYALVQGYVLWMGCIYVLVNLLVDIINQLLDPRIRRASVER